jgi:hypothetical protein
MLTTLIISVLLSGGPAGTPPQPATTATVQAIGPHGGVYRSHNGKLRLRAHKGAWRLSSQFLGVSCEPKTIHIYHRKRVWVTLYCNIP